MKKIVLSALAVASLAGTTFGQTIGPSLGTVELRWRERSTAGFNGSYVLGAGAVGVPASTGGTNATAAQTTQQDAVVVLVLEARVTGNVGGPAIRGLAAAGFDIKTNQASGGAFSVYTNTDGTPALNPRGSTTINTTSLGFNPNSGYANNTNPDNGGTLPGYNSADRGVVAPFRAVALNNSSNGPALGVLTADGNTLNKVTLGAQASIFSGGDATNPGEWNLLGLDTWVPVYIATYNISDVSTARDIVFSIGNSPSTPPVTDYGFRTSTGSPNSQNGGLDIWALSPAFTSSPTFTVSIVPAPGAAALLGLGGLVAARRRRTA